MDLETLKLLLLYGGGRSPDDTRELEELLREYERRSQSARRAQGVNTGLSALPSVLPQSPARNLTTLLALANLASGTMGGPTAGKFLAK